ncbi:MAG: hypothetical protein K6F94_07805 [Bacteroidaceae bacterium]|nr:hypothetical protein [Bacteroidaceae bacterium]
MKKHFTMLFIAVLTATNVQAWQGEEFDPTRSYYIQNVTNGLFLTSAPGFSAEPTTQWTPEWAKTDDDGIETYNFKNGGKYIYIYDSWRGWSYDIYIDMRNGSYRWRLEKQNNDFVYALRSNHTLATGNTFSQNHKYLYMASNGEAVGYAENASDANAQWIFISEEQTQLMQTVASAQSLIETYTSTPEAASMLSAMINNVIGEDAELPTTAAAFAEATAVLKYAIDAFKQAVTLEPGMEVTNMFIINPSFEQGPYLVNSVTGWEGTKFEGNEGEAFSSYKIADRTFDGIEGDYLYNTWGGTPSGDYSLSQNLGVIPAGKYELNFVVASDDTENKLNCTFGKTPYSLSFGSDKTVGIPVSITTEADGKTALSIVLRCAGWFKADAFHLVYKDYPTGLQTVEGAAEASSPNRAYDISGRPSKQQNKRIIIKGGKKFFVK